MGESDMSSYKKEKSGWQKLIGFILIVALCLIVGNVILALLAIAGGLSISEGLDIFSAISDPEMRPYIKTGIGLNHLIMFTGSAVLFAYWLKRKDWGAYFLTKKIDVGILLSFVLLLICAYPIIGASAMVFEGVEWASQMDESSIEALMKMLQMDNFFDLLVNLIIVALLPAIGEELLFRGVIQRELVAKMKNHHIAIIIASVIFSGVHLQIQGFLPKFFIGLILGYAYYWTKSIWYPMALHFFNNGMQTLLLFFAADEMESIQDEPIQSENLILAIVVVFSCFLCYLIIQNIRKLIGEKQNLNA